MYKDINKLTNKGYEFERVVEEIFAKSKYEIIKEYQKTRNYDIIAKKDSLTYYIEVKYNISKNLDLISKQIDIINRRNEIHDYNNCYRYVLVLSVMLTEAERYNIEKINHNLIIIDLANLLFAVYDDEEMKAKLLSILPNKVNISPLENKTLHLYSKNTLYAISLIDSIKNCPTGKKASTKFENICIDILKYLFANSLTLWEKQKVSNENLYRFDLTCRVKDDRNCTFWSIVEEYFNSKYVVFEFKNYDKNTTQYQIYTTERYLYRKAFRNVAIMICANGVDDNSMWAAKGCLRENGKLILPIDKEDVVKMIEMKMRQEEPSDYLQSKLDAMLLELEK